MRFRPFLSVFILLWPAFCALAAETSSPGRIFSGSVRAGLKQSFLDVEGQRECANCPPAPLDYKTEGVNVYEIDGSLNVWGGPLVRLELERPFKRSDNQDELLRAQRSSDASYEKYAAGLLLDSVAARYLTGDDLSGKILRKLCSLKYVRTKEVFFGRVKPNADSVFIPIDGLIDYGSLTILTGTNLSAGDELTFKTDYTDTELSVGVVDVAIPQFQLAPAVVRVGYYWANWRRLTDTQVSGLSSRPIIYEAEFKTQGVLVSLESRDRAAPGLNLDLAAKIGTKDTIKAPIDWNRLTQSDVDIQTRMVRFGAWYNYYLNKDTKKGWSFSAGGSMDLRETNVKTGSSGFVQEIPVSQNRDLILKYFVSTGYRF